MQTTGSSKEKGLTSMHLSNVKVSYPMETERRLWRSKVQVTSWFQKTETFSLKVPWCWLKMEFYTDSCQCVRVRAPSLHYHPYTWSWSLFWKWELAEHSMVLGLVCLSSVCGLPLFSHHKHWKHFFNKQKFTCHLVFHRTVCHTEA